MLNDELWELGKRFGILQKKNEFLELLRYLKQRPSLDTILEIGVNSGGTTVIFSQIFNNCYAIDLFIPGHLHGLDNVHFIQGNSHDPKVIEQVKDIQFDVLFIDADHSLKAATKDYMNYRKFVKPGGLIIFHDITCETGSVLDQPVEVNLLWSCIKNNNCFEIKDNTNFPDSVPLLNSLPIDTWGGIGVMTV